MADCIIKVAFSVTQSEPKALFENKKRAYICSSSLRHNICDLFNTANRQHRLYQTAIDIMKASETNPVTMQDGQMTRRAILRKAGWITPLVVGYSLIEHGYGREYYGEWKRTKRI